MLFLVSSGPSTRVSANSSLHLLDIIYLPSLPVEGLTKIKKASAQAWPTSLPRYNGEILLVSSYHLNLCSFRNKVVNRGVTTSCEADSLWASTKARFWSHRTSDSEKELLIIPKDQLETRKPRRRDRTLWTQVIERCFMSHFSFLEAGGLSAEQVRVIRESQGSYSLDQMRCLWSLTH